MVTSTVQQKAYTSVCQAIPKMRRGQPVGPELGRNRRQGSERASSSSHPQDSRMATLGVIAQLPEVLYPGVQSDVKAALGPLVHPESRAATQDALAILQ